jgi:hypothetical protein
VFDRSSVFFGGSRLVDQDGSDLPLPFVVLGCDSMTVGVSHPAGHGPPGLHVTDFRGGCDGIATLVERPCNLNAVKTLSAGSVNVGHLRHRSSGRSGDNAVTSTPLWADEQPTMAL